MLVDWLAKGQQQQTIRRGCARKEEHPNPKACTEGQSDQTKVLYKDCVVTCPESLCNIENDELFQLFAPKDGVAQDSCHTCSYHQRNSGLVEGVPECVDEPDHARECPVWAGHGCYVGSAIHFVKGEEREDVHRGCSSFEISSVSLKK